MLVGCQWELAAVGAVLDRTFAGQGCVVEPNERYPPALVHGGDVTPIVDAEVIEPDCTDFLDSSSVEQASGVSYE